MSCKFCYASECCLHMCCVTAGGFFSAIKRHRGIRDRLRFCVDPGRYIKVYETVQSPRRGQPRPKVSYGLPIIKSASMLVCRTKPRRGKFFERRANLENTKDEKSESRNVENTKEGHFEIPKSEESQNAEIENAKKYFSIAPHSSCAEIARNNPHQLLKH